MKCFYLNIACVNNANFKMKIYARDLSAAIESAKNKIKKFRSAKEVINIECICEY